MADITSGVELSQRLDERYALVAEKRRSAREAVQAVAAEQAEALKRAEQIRNARATEVTDEARRLNAEQRMRDQQLEIDLRLLEQERLDAAQYALEQAAHAGEGPNRGAIVDLLA